MTNSMNDIRHAKSILIVGENIATSHPIAMQHVLHAKEVNGARVIVIDPRFSKTAAFAHRQVSIRQGTDVALMYGLINIILKNGWEDKKMLRDRTYGFSYLKKELRKYDLKTVSNVTGVSQSNLNWIARQIAKNRPGTVIWAMGGTQHSNGTSVTRSFCLLQLVLGNMGRSGGGANVFRGHDNVQGVTDLGVLSNTLPGYYGLSVGKAYKHWSNVWGVDHGWMKGRFANDKMMGKKGFTVARWYEGVLMNKKDLGQDTNVHAVFYWGHSINSQSQMDRVKKALEKVELLVDVDPFVTITSVLPDRKDGAYMLPAATVYEQRGSITNSNRDIQWRNRLVEPVFESRTDLDIIVDLANRLGFGKQFTKNRKGAWKKDSMVEDIVGEWNMGMRTIGMVGQTVKRMQRQQKWAHAFSVDTKMAEGGPVDGEQWGMPWPCWTDKHPGTQILYNTNLPVAKGGMGFRARWGTKVPDDGQSLLAGKGAAPPRSSIDGGYAELPAWKTDLTGKVFRDAIAKGLAPYGNGRARIRAWNLKDDPVPKHREPIHTPRPDLISKFPTYDDVKDHYRVPTLFKSLQKRDWAKKFPVILNTGRQVEFEGGGNAERAMWWLVELQPEMYAEIHPKLANNHRIKHGDWMWIESPEDLDDKPSKVKVKAKVTRRVPDNMVYLPFHWGGSFEGKDYSGKYPDGYVPYGIGESANVVTNYGYDRITQMQETKGGLCRIKKA